MMARAPLPLQYVLGSTITCSVLLKLEVEDLLLDRNKDKTDGLMGKLLNKMAVVKESGNRGLVHCVGGGEGKWTCIGEKDKEERTDRRREWMVEGVGSRTRGASKWRFDYEGSAGFEDNGVNEKFGGDIYEFDESDMKQFERVSKNITKGDYIDDEEEDYDSLAGLVDKGMTAKGMGKGTRLGGIPNDKFIDESDDEKDGEWLGKTGKGRGKRKGRGRGKKLGGVPKDEFDNFIDDEEEVKTG